MSEMEAAAEQELEPEKVFKRTMDDGHEITVYPPTEGQFAMLMAAMGRGSTDSEQIGGVINFFCDLLDGSDRRYIEGRLMDREDEFSKKGVYIIQSYLEELIEGWSGRPTKSFSVYTPSPENDGEKSTAATPESTSSESLSLSF